MNTFTRYFVTLASLMAVPAAVEAGAQVTVHSTPVGVVSSTLSHERGLSLPLVAPSVFVGVVSANSGSTLTFPSQDGNLGARLTAGTPYYVEVATGPLEGERFDIDTGATIASGDSTLTLNLSQGSFSTLNTLGANALTGARCILRPHMTLSSLQAMFSPALTGKTSPALSDGVELFEAGHWQFYYLKKDGASWGRIGKQGDFRDKVIPPDESLLVSLNSGDKLWVDSGSVRTNAFRKNLTEGVQSFATGFPEAMSPVEVGAFVDTSEPASIRWMGSRGPARADQFVLLFGPQNPYNLYFLWSDGTTWKQFFQSANAANDPLLTPDEMILLRRNNADSSYLIPVPYQL